LPGSSCKWWTTLARANYGIAHQDIAPRNPLVDKEADNLPLYDFNAAAQTGRLRGHGFLNHW
jgi:hypothetical protein